MKYFLWGFLLFFATASNPVFAIEAGDKVLDIAFGLSGDKIVRLKIFKRKYERYTNDKKFRSIDQTNTKVVLVDVDGKVLESAYAVFHESIPPLDIDEKDAANMKKRYSGVVFKQDPKAHIQPPKNRTASHWRTASSLERS